MMHLPATWWTEPFDDLAAAKLEAERSSAVVACDPSSQLVLGNSTRLVENEGPGRNIGGVRTSIKFLAIGCQSSSVVDLYFVAAFGFPIAVDRPSDVNLYLVSHGKAHGQGSNGKEELHGDEARAKRVK